MSIEVKGIFSLLILVADIWARLNIFGSNRETGSKVLWTLLILFLPVMGWLIWFFAGPRGNKA